MEKSFKPFGFGIVRDGSYYWIVSVKERNIEDLSKEHGYPWTNIGIAYKRKEMAIRMAKSLASIVRTKYVEDHLYL